MTQAALSNQQFPEIHSSDLSSEDARRSRPVSHEEFQSLAAEGQQRYEALKQHSRPTTGLDQNWRGIVNRAHKSVSEPWGGATIDSHTGEFLHPHADAYAITVKEPGMDSVSIPATAPRRKFNQAMKNARETFRPVLERENHSLGVFHDADKNSIDIDPVTTVGSKHEVETIGAYTRATGGAYHFKSGDGYWPPHVR